MKPLQLPYSYQWTEQSYYAEGHNVQKRIGNNASGRCTYGNEGKGAWPQLMSSATVLRYVIVNTRPQLKIATCIDLD
jgi:hypothetical protein